MKLSKSAIKTLKNSKDYDAKNATLLIRAGFIDQTMAGVYTFLNPGLRVLNKIETVVREEMDKISTEIYMPVLSPIEFWKKTKRFDSVDVLMKAVAANPESSKWSTNEYVINPTHEDVITPLMQKFVNSYKDLPVAVYQIQGKVRNEGRPKSGIMRTREFRMKDLYSFHTSEESLLSYYNNEATSAYDTIYERLGLGKITHKVAAHGGDFTEEYSREWQTECESGEDLIFGIPEKNIWFNQEVAPSKAPEVEQETERKEMKVVETAGVTGMDSLEEFLGVDASHSMKTLIYETDDGRVIAAGIRGNYDVNEIKLAKVVGCKRLELASEETINKVTGAEVGYAGIVDLPDNVELYVDDSMENAVNFECGANKTDHHNLNVNWDVDVARPEKFYDIKIAQEGDLYPETGEVYTMLKTSEVGNIFPLNTKYTEAFDFTVTDENGEKIPVYMGSYGIGTSRLVGVIAEIFNDEAGLMWPIQVAPFHVQLITLGESENVIKEAEALYRKLEEVGVEVLWDDRTDVSAGSKFADADLIGCPMRVVVSDRSLQNGGYEFKLRNEPESDVLNFEDLLTEISTQLENAGMKLSLK